MNSATIKLHIPNGDAKSLRTAEIINWTGWAIAAPRTELDDLLRREELEKAGVYILVGTDSETGRPRAYIGEAEIIRDRLKQHRAKDFWVSIIVFVSKDENLTKGHIKYLEGRLLNEAAEVGRAILENSASSGSKLPEADRADMDVFLSRIRQLLPVLRSDLLTPVSTVSARTDPNTILVCKRKTVVARGKRTPSGFVVLAGSTASASNSAALEKNSPAIATMRKQMVNDGTLVPKNDVLEFQKDVEFTSPSAAASVVFGTNANGLTEWQDGTGRTLKGIDEAIGS